MAKVNAVLYGDYDVYSVGYSIDTPDPMTLVSTVGDIRTYNGPFSSVVTVNTATGQVTANTGQPGVALAIKSPIDVAQGGEVLLVSATNYTGGVTGAATPFDNVYGNGSQDNVFSPTPGTLITFGTLFNGDDDTVGPLLGPSFPMLAAYGPHTSGTATFEFFVYEGSAPAPEGCFWTNLTNAVCGAAPSTVVTVDATSDIPAVGSGGGFALTTSSWIAGGTDLISAGITANATATVTRIAGPVGPDSAYPGDEVDTGALPHDLTGPALLTLPVVEISLVDMYFQGAGTTLDTLLEDLTGSPVDNMGRWYYIEVSIATVGTFTALVYMEFGT